MQHIMVDLETMGSKPGSAIASIGAVAFDPVVGTLGADFYQVVDLVSCERAGLTLDASTVYWWMDKSDAARKALGGAKLDLCGSLARFAWWIEDQCRGQRPRLWGHGGNFDEPMLAAACRAVSMPSPWRYSEGRCTRTIFEAAGVELDRTAPQAGTRHNALDDAKVQARAVCWAYEKLGLSVPRIPQVVA